METKEMTKEEVFEYLKDTKILCTSTDETTKVQKKLFELGIGWSILGTSITNKYLLFINDDRLEFTPDIDFWVRSEKKRIEPSEILLLELKEEKPKFDPKSLQPFDKVLVREIGGIWVARFFDIYTNGYCVTSGHRWSYCIPYNEDTEHLYGTTEDAPEFYRI